MASRAIALSAAVVATIAALCAYTNHMDLTNRGEDFNKVKVDEAQMRRVAHSVASEAMEEQRKCLVKDPGEWCNRDLRYENHYRSAYSLATKNKYAFSEGSTNRQDRNQWLLILAGSSLVLAFQVCGLFRDRRGKRTESAA